MSDIPPELHDAFNYEYARTIPKDRFYRRRPPSAKSFRTRGPPERYTLAEWQAHWRAFHADFVRRRGWPPDTAPGFLRLVRRKNLWCGLEEED